MKILDQIKGKKVLILGVGREGLSTYLFLRKKFPHQEITIADRQTFTALPLVTRTHLTKDSRLKLILSRDYLKSVREFDLIFVSSGVYPNLLTGLKNKTISSNTELFFEEFRGKIIGVTGTKGKSTSASLIYHVLKSNGMKVHLGGNIGKAALSLLPELSSNDLVVLELSSYQLLRLKRSPHIAVIQEIVPEHLDYHGSFESYVEAKANIVKYQSAKDYVVYNSKSTIATKIAEKSLASKIPLSDFSNEIEEQTIPLKGSFNLQNVLPAIAVGRILGIPYKKISEAVKIFKPLEHRLEFVATVKGVEYYNDSLSTIPESAIAAIKSFPDKNKILLLGGFDRGLDFSELAKIILGEKIKGLILFPTTGEKIWNEILNLSSKNKSLPLHFFTASMTEAVRKAAEWAADKDIVLLSPASSSFSVFKDYIDRGNQFKEEVGSLVK